MVYNFFQNTEEKGTLPNLFCEAGITLVPNADKGSKKKKIKQKNPPSPRQTSNHSEHRCSILNKALANQTQQCLKITHSVQVGFIPGVWGWVNIWKSTNVTRHMIEVKKKKNMILSVDPDKALDKI